MISYILDTDHLSLHQRGHEPLRSHLMTVPPEQIAITIISVEELLRGRLAQVRRATKAADRANAYAWLHKTFDFLRDFNILKYEMPAELQFQALRVSKVKIGTQDLKIASITLTRTSRNSNNDGTRKRNRTPKFFRVLFCFCLQLFALKAKILL